MSKPNYTEHCSENCFGLKQREINEHTHQPFLENGYEPKYSFTQERILAQIIY